MILQNMIKFLKYIAIASLMMLSVSCEEEQKEIPEPILEVTPNNIEGIWQLTEWRGEALPEGRYFYIVLERKDCLFTTYENTASFGVHKETGYYNIIQNDSVEGAIIRGLKDCSMGEEWNHQYIVSDLTSGKMTWTVIDDLEDISIYTRIEALPEFITE